MVSSARFGAQVEQTVSIDLLLPARKVPNRPVGRAAAVAAAAAAAWQAPRAAASGTFVVALCGTLYAALFLRLSLLVLAGIAV